MSVKVKRIYEPAAGDDGYRVLIDRLWPRGVSKAAARLDDWAKELSPSDELRRWYGHEPEKFDRFAARYREELAAHGEKLDELRQRAAHGTVTILFGARDGPHSNAAVLIELLEPSSTPTTVTDKEAAQ